MKTILLVITALCSTSFVLLSKQTDIQVHSSIILKDTTVSDTPRDVSPPPSISTPTTQKPPR